MSAPNDPQTSEMFFWWALGLDRDDIAKVTGISKNMVNKKLSPGEDYIANLLEDCNSDSILNYIEYLGLDRQFNKELLLNAADKLDIPLEKEMKQQGKKEILKYLLDKLDKREQCISMNPTNMHLRYIIWSIMSASAHHENIEYSLDNLLYRTVNYKGSILAGDAFTTFFERRHRLKQNNIIISFDNDRSWESLKDSKNYENLRRHYVWKICYAMGWSRFMSGIENKKQIWNGTNLRLDDIRYIDRDDRENAELTLYTRPASYVAHLGTNYGILQDPGLACKFASKSFRQSFAGDMKDLLDKARKAMNAYDIADTENIVEFLKQEWPEDIETNLCEIIDHFLALERKKLRKLDNNENERSIMANLLSVNTTYITQDKYVIIQKRGKNCGHGGDYRFQTSAAGFVALPVDLSAYPIHDLPSFAPGNTCPVYHIRYLPSFFTTTGRLISSSHPVSFLGPNTMTGSLQ